MTKVEYFSTTRFKRKLAKLCTRGMEKYHGQSLLSLYMCTKPPFISQASKWRCNDQPTSNPFRNLYPYLLQTTLHMSVQVHRQVAPPTG